MPTNLHALIRYRTIDECLNKRGRHWTWESLAQACADKIYEYEGLDVIPSRRTIMYDINAMRDGKLGYYAPIIYDRATRSYHYDDPDFSIQKFPLGKDDLFELQYALSILKNFKGFANTSGIENIITKLEHTVTLQETSHTEVIHFDHSLNEPGQRWLHELYDYIQQENVIEIKYQPFYLDEAYFRLVSPYILKEYDNRWFLICYDHKRDDLRNFALDRLIAVEKKPIRFHRTPGFNPRHYFENIIGVTLPKDEKVEEVCFKVSVDNAKYLLTKPIHSSQRVIKETATHFVFEIKVIPNFELESVLLSLGDQLEVVGPASLRKKLAARIHLMANQYEQIDPMLDSPRV